jgi:hypothetical protein
MEAVFWLLDAYDPIMKNAHKKLKWQKNQKKVPAYPDILCLLIKFSGEKTFYMAHIKRTKMSGE